MPFRSQPGSFSQPVCMGCEIGCRSWSSRLTFTWAAVLVLFWLSTTVFIHGPAVLAIECVLSLGFSSTKSVSNTVLSMWAFGEKFHPANLTFIIYGSHDILPPRASPYIRLSSGHKCAGIGLGSTGSSICGSRA